MKNRILAMDAAPAAKPPNPKTAAIIATIRKVIVQRNIMKILNDKSLWSLVEICIEKCMPKCYWSQMI